MRQTCGMGRAMAALVLAVAIISTAVAQPSERPEGPAGRGGNGPAGRAGEGPIGRGGEGRRGPPSPERFVEHAMSFDADGDGKLDRAELTKLAEEMARMRGGQGGPGGQSGPGGQGGPGGSRGPGRGGAGGFGPPGAPGGDESGERSVRPRRPE